MAPENQPKTAPWNYRAEIISPCNCDWGCPCTFNQPPTHGFCEGGWILRVLKGQAGDVDLTGLSFAYMGSWPKALHFGGGTTKLLIEARASAAQQEAIEQIAKGERGGKPLPLLAKTISLWRPVLFVPFEWSFDGPRGGVSAGEVLKTVLQPMRNPVSGKEVNAKIILPDGILTCEENVTTTQTFSVFADDFKYAWPGRNAWYGTVEHGT